MLEAKYKAFISYSHWDNRWARWLHRSLEDYKPPKHLVGQSTEMGVIPKQLTPVFRDREELPSATDLGRIINEALQNSATLVVICSPAAAKSKWVNEEILAYKRLGGEDRIFCLIVGGEPNASDIPGQKNKECFPEALRYRLGENGELTDQRTEPIAADARDNKDGKTSAKLKLIAGMLGVGYDSLRQRELHRRQRRLAAIASASIGGMVITTGLAISAFLARAEAEAQRIIAQEEADKQTEIVKYMEAIFMVSDPNEALGNTITAREILDRAVRRIEFELGDQPAIRAKLMDTMGTVYRSLGLWNEARPLLESGLETRRRLYGDRHPDVAASKANLAELLGLQAEFDQSETLYQQAIATLRADEDADPEELALLLYGLAQVRVLQSDYASAEDLLREAIDKQRPEAQSESLELARSLDTLGRTLEALARYDEAEDLLREALAMRRKLIPGGVHTDLVDSLNNIAAFLYEAGEYEETEALFREALAINTQLLGDDNVDVTISMSNLAFVLHDAGDLDGAQEYYEAVLEIRRSKLPEDHPMIASADNNLAFLYYDKGDMQRAQEYMRRAVDTYRNIYPGDNPNTAYSLQNLAGWLLEDEDYATAETLLDEALAMNQRILPADHPDIAISQSGMAALRLETGQPEQSLAFAAAARESLINSFGADHWRVAWAGALEGASFTRLGRFTEAEPLLLEAYAILESSPGARQAQLQSARRYLSELYTAWGRPEDAARYQALVASN